MDNNRSCRFSRQHKLAATLVGLCLIASGQASAQSLTTSQQTVVSNLSGASFTIKNQLATGLSFSAGFSAAANNGTIVDPTTWQAATITEQQRTAYNTALATYQSTDFYNARQFFQQQAANSITQMQQAISLLSSSAVELQKAVSVNQMVSGVSDSMQAKQVQTAIANSGLSSEIGAATVGNYNHSLAQVNSYATQAAAFFRAADNTQLTNTVDLTKTNYGKNLEYAGAHFVYADSTMLIGWADGFGFSVGPVLDAYKQSSEGFYQANNLTFGAQ